MLLRRDGNFTKENLKQGPQSASSEHLHSSLHHSVASPVKKEEFLFTELNKSHGSSEMSGKPTEEANGSKESDHNEDVKERNRKEPDGSNGQQTHKLSSVSDYHKTDVAGHSSTETTNGKENITSTDQADTGYSDKSAGVTITLSTVSDSLDEHKHTNDDDKEIDPLEEESIVSEKGMNKQNESHPSSNDTNLATNEENITGSEKMEWVRKPLEHAHIMVTLNLIKSPPPPIIYLCPSLSLPPQALHSSESLFLSRTLTLLLPSY